ncbi:hypothetical protein SAMN06298212_1226 [Ruaniaceae bacterium KH17]|nr:hypothetical protein SAMN06298212_1226 [Ruaniaceae bacterium KH17]
MTLPNMLNNASTTDGHIPGAHGVEDSVSRSHPQAECPIRPGDPCSLCFPGADGPENCGLVYLVQDDPEMAATLNQERAKFNRAQRLAKQADFQPASGHPLAS